jgi:hypothetical protein
MSIKITAIGEGRILCRWFYRGEFGDEGKIVLSFREWSLVETDGSMEIS